MSRPTTPRPFASVGTTVIPVSIHATGVANVEIFNPSNATAFLQLFNKKMPGDVTLGTTAPHTWVSVAAGQARYLDPQWLFDTGLQIAAATTATGSAAPSAALQVVLGLNE